MIRHFNYTNRIRINRRDVIFTLQRQNGGYWFDADLSKLHDYELPEDSLVFVEAYRQTFWKRFSYGQVGALVADKDCSLTQFESPEGILFRVKITPPDDTHKLLADAYGIPLLQPEQQQVGKEPLLSVKPQKIGSEIYRLDLFSGDLPLLLINSEIGNYRDIARSSVFTALVYPAVVRQILTRVVITDKHDDETDSGDWRSRWLKYAKQFPSVEDVPDTDDSEECEKWIDDVVSEFAKSIQAFAKFTEFWKKEGA